MPRLSVIVPIYKVEKYLRTCIDSILHQTFTDFELILVDDGSPDQCGKICDEYATTDSRVRVIHKAYGGVSDARNQGLGTARGEIIGFVDSDDKIAPDMYRTMIQYMDDHQLDIVCADTYVVKNSREAFRPRYREDKIFTRKEAINEILDGTIDNAVWNKIYKRSIMGDIRFPAGRIYEDVATVYLWFYQAERVGYLFKPFYYYLKREGSIVQQAFNSKDRYDCFCGYKERLEFAKQHHLNCVEKCEVQALTTALATLTAFYATNESTASDRYLDVTGFIKNHTASRFANRLKPKHRFLINCFQYCPPLYKLYAALSSWSKKASHALLSALSSTL